MRAATGSPEVIMKTGKKFRVYFTKARLSDKPDDYLIDHSIMFYLMDDEVCVITLSCRSYHVDRALYLDWPL
jgi:cytochrome oxidase Cu insertion factor (SCO1/SenC/PrrC family)